VFADVTISELRAEAEGWIIDRWSVEPCHSRWREEPRQRRISEGSWDQRANDHGRHPPIEDYRTFLEWYSLERADRFSDYKESRIEDAQRAHDAVHRIADNIPFGQPILVGHHSERHARKDAERIENGMRKTVQMWQTARYWEQRAAGALHHVSRCALPGDSRVTLFSDLRTAFDRETLHLTWRLLYFTGRHFPANYRDAVDDGKAAMQAR
jgi:hypothetical protein